MHPLRTLLALCSLGTIPAVDLGPNLVLNGDFSREPVDWHLVPGTEIASDDHNRYLHMTNSTTVAYGREIAIQPGWKVMHVSAKVRITGFHIGSEPWKMVRIATSFVLEDGRTLHPRMAQLDRDTKGWEIIEADAEVPEHAKRFTIQCAHFGSAGSVDFDDLVLTAR